MTSSRTPRFLLLLLILMAAPLLLAQEPEPERPPELDVADIESRIAALEGSALDAPVKAALKTAYTEALTFLGQADEHQRRQQEFDRKRAEAPELLKTYRQRLTDGIAPIDTAAVAGAELAEIEQRRNDAEASLAEARRSLVSLTTESGERNERRQAISERLAAVSARLTQISDQLSGQTPADLSPDQIHARRVRLEAEQVALRAETATLKGELASYVARRELLSARTDWARKRVSSGEDAVKAWQTLVDVRRRAEAEEDRRAAEEAAKAAEERLRREAIQAAPKLLSIANYNRSLAALRSGESGLPEQLAELAHQHQEAEERLADLREQFRIVRRKVSVAGVNAMGQLLRKQLASLPEVTALESASLGRAELISNVQLELIEREEQRSQVDVERQLEDVLAALTTEERGRIRGVARELLTKKRELLDDLIREYTLIFERLVELQDTTRQLIQGTREYRAYIEERILWVRSAPPAALPNPTTGFEAAAWLFGASSWSDVLQVTGREMRAEWPQASLWVALLVLLFAAHLFCKRGLERAADLVWKPKGDEYGHTLRALLFTTMLALPFPILAWGAGYWLSKPAGQAEVGVAAGEGLKAIAVFLLAIEAMRHVLRPRGLGSSHFRWRSSEIGYLRFHLRWFLPVILVTSFVAQSLDHQPNSLFNDSLGRLAFFAQVVVLAVFIHRVLRPKGPVFATYLQRNRGGWIDRLRYVWYPVAIGLPVALGIVSLRGYHYSAMQLLERLQTSLWIVLSLVLVNALLIRWLRLTRTRLILKQAAAEQAAARRAAAERAAQEERERQEREEREREEREREERERQEQEERERKAAGAEAKGETAEGEEPVEAEATESKPADAGDAEAQDEADSDAEGEPDPLSRPTPPPSTAAPPTDHASLARRDLFSTEGTPAGDTSSLLDLDQVDHAAMSSQLQQLFRSVIAVVVMIGFFAVWVDVLPALKRLDQIQIWPTVQYVEAQTENRYTSLEPDTRQDTTQEGASGGVTPLLPGQQPELPQASDDSAIPEVVTLADLGLSILILAFTFVAARNLPALLQYVLLQRLDIDAGTRYAVRTVASYAIVFVGLTVGFRTVGFRWDSIQWLAAALTFGLAFGLQEIFANFVSGLIILFERPVRLGDWVTVGDVTGVVSRIRIRATTITDLNRKELIVPNKEFVTGNVINWALSDSILRLVLPVGLAYGLDTGLARQLMLDVAKHHPDVMDDPRPEAYFMEFGDSTLNLYLYAFIDHPAKQYHVRDELNRGIDRAFKEHDLEIAFPQMDLHLRSAEAGLLERLHTRPPQPPPLPGPPPT